MDAEQVSFKQNELTVDITEQVNVYHTKNVAWVDLKWKIIE